MDGFSATFYQQAGRLLKRGVEAMKISVDVDCTPEEARRFMGLPDLSSVHAVYVGKIERMIEDGVTSENVESMMRAWAPMGEAGMTMWRQMFDQLSGPSKR